MSTTSASNLPADPAQTPGAELSRDELACPLCGYSLRGLIDPRCPECGFAFEWDELLDAKRQHHPYLFEHGRGRNLITFCMTLWFSHLPWRFWTDLNPAMPVRRFRLLMYWIIASSILLLVPGVPLATVTVNLVRHNRAQRAFFHRDLNRPGWLVDSRHRLMPEKQLAIWYPLPGDELFLHEVFDQTFRFRNAQFLGMSLAELDLIGSPIVLAWPVLSLLTLLIFRASMRQAKIKPEHVLRTVIYGCDFALPMVLLGMVVTMGFSDLSIGWQSVAIMLFCFAFGTVKMSSAFGRYLRVHRPVATVLATQVIVLMTVLVLLLYSFNFTQTVF